MIYMIAYIYQAVKHLAGITLEDEFAFYKYLVVLGGLYPPPPPNLYHHYNRFVLELRSSLEPS